MKRDYSTISDWVSIAEHIYWTLWFYFVYKRIIFISIDSYSVKFSKAVFLGSMIIVSVISFMVRRNRYMTRLSVMSDVVIGAGIYTVIAYKKYYMNWFICHAVVFGVGMVIYSLLIFNKRNKGRKISEITDKHTRMLVIKNRLNIINNAAGIYLAAIVAVMSIPILYNT